MGTINIREPSLNVVIHDKPNVLIGLNQNGKRSGMAPWSWVIVDSAPPAKRRDPPHSEIDAEQGKPVVSPETAGEPQGIPLVLRVKEQGKSESRSVMGWIGVAISPHEKSGRLPYGLSSQESF